MYVMCLQCKQFWIRLLSEQTKVWQLEIQILAGVRAKEFTLKFKNDCSIRA